MARYDLWLDPRQFHLDDPEVRALAARSVVDRVILDAFINGQTLFPSRDPLFAQMDYYREHPDALSAFLKEMKRRGKKVYAALGCLAWFDGGGPSIFAKHPDLAELDEPKGPARQWASPFNPKVREVLRGLAAELLETGVEWDGFVLQCRQDMDILYAYSTSALAASIKETGLDPLSNEVFLYRYDRDSDTLHETPQGAVWRRWRLSKVASLVNELAQTLRTGRPGTWIAAVGPADFPRWPLERQCYSLEDVAGWARLGILDEVILEPDWPDAARGYAAQLTALAALPRPPQVAVLVDADKLYVDEAWQMLAGQTVSRAIFRLRPLVPPEKRDAATTRNYNYITKVDKENVIWRILPRADLRQLEVDPRLQGNMVLRVNPEGWDTVSSTDRASLGEAFKALTTATGLSMTATCQGRPAEDRIIRQHNSLMEAWRAMQDLALHKEVQGWWEKTDTGYKLVLPRAIPGPDAARGASSERSGPVEPPPSFFPVWLVGLSAAALAIVAASLLLRSWRRRRTTAP